jgi:hypothetical protein
LLEDLCAEEAAQLIDEEAAEGEDAYGSAGVESSGAGSFRRRGRPFSLWGGLPDHLFSRGAHLRTHSVRSYSAILYRKW